MSDDRAHAAHQSMGPGHEFDAIRDLIARWGDLAVGIGDDTAILASRAAVSQVVTVDACVENVHFRRPWLSAREIGARAITAAVSDVAAMGALPTAILLAFIVPDAWRAELASVADGIGDVVRANGARIVGGNLSRGDTFSITTTVLGEMGNVSPSSLARSPVTRRGALAGDLLLVSGRLGGPADAIAAWSSGTTPSVWARDRFAAPVARLAEGRALADAGAHAMLDISDGLLADARHLAAASGVTLRIDASALPRGPGISAETALASGEEYELLAALSRADARTLLESWPAQFQTPLTVIGEVLEDATASNVQPQSDAGQPVQIDRMLVTISPSGIVTTDLSKRVEFEPGHDHFSR